MSSAFVKEPEGNEAFDNLPDRLISLHPNFVTAAGLAAIEAARERLARDYAAAQAAGDRTALAATARDLRYWTARRASAQVVPPPADGNRVQFGSTVTVARDGGRKTYRIVGEDEADPAMGTLSHVAPLARALFGRQVGDIVRAGSSDAEVIAIA
jgi:transcription elongation GreA/GreB family factor